MKTKEQLNELEEITKPVIEWLKKYCNPYESVVIDDSEVKVVGINAGIPL